MILLYNEKRGLFYSVFVGCKSGKNCMANQIGEVEYTKKPYLKSIFKEWGWHTAENALRNKNNNGWT